MTKYTCVTCKKKFGIKEYSLTNDSKRCILHCQKDNWYETKDDGAKIWKKSESKVIYFWCKLDKFINKTSANYCELISVVFPVFSANRILFTYEYVVEKDILVDNGIFLDEAIFHSTVFNGKVYVWLHISLENSLTFSYCSFNKDVHFQLNHKNTQNKKEPLNLSFEDSTFNKKLFISNCDYSSSSLSFENAVFNDLVDFKNTTFNDVNFTNTKFNGTTIFIDCVFKKEIDFRTTTFTSETNFLDITSKERKKDTDSNFLDELTPVKVKDRETARIIKHNFEKLGNKIEANKYHALELEQKRKKLESEEPRNWQEYLVFKLHDLSSEHSTNWLLAVLWVMTSGFVSSFIVQIKSEIGLVSVIVLLFTYIFLVLFSESKYYKLVYPPIAISVIAFCFLYVNNILDFKEIMSYMSLITLTNSELVIIGFTEDSLGVQQKLVLFLNKVSLGYLYYQFLMSVRKDTRK